MLKVSDIFDRRRIHRLNSRNSQFWPISVTIAANLSMWYGIDMQDILQRIRQLLRENTYQNEEHVRLSLVCHVLQALGWDIWDPREVNAEFVPNRAEDNTKVDLALFVNRDIPAVFIETKSVGKMDGKLHAIEGQVRDYNRNNTALFSIITDGQKWRFYYSQTGGQFHQKCFRQFDFLKDEPESIENILDTFLTKKGISGDAENKAREYLQLSVLQKAIQDCASEAERLTNRSPFPRKPEAIVQLLKKQWPNLTVDEVERHLEKGHDGFSQAKADAGHKTEPIPKPSQSNRGKFVESRIPEDFQHARMRGTVMGHKENGWNPCIRKAVALALDNGFAADLLDSNLPVNIKDGRHVSDGFKPVPGHHVSLQQTEANTAFATLSTIAEMLQCNIDIELLFRHKSAYAGKEMTIRLSKDGAKRIA